MTLTSHPTAPESARPARSFLRRTSVRAGLVGGVAALTVGLVGGVAGADTIVYAGGTTFIGSTRCDTLHRYIQGYATPSRLNVTAYAQLWIQPQSTGRWLTGPWHPIGNGNQLNFGASDFTFGGHGYYRVFVYYAQLTSAGWAYNGAYETQYSQGLANGLTVNSTTCYV